MELPEVLTPRAIPVSRMNFLTQQDLMGWTYHEGIKIMQIMESSVHHDEGHYCFDLPFKTADAILPKNHKIAEQCLLYFQRKFKMNKDYHQEYTSILFGVIGTVYAEKVP